MDLGNPFEVVVYYFLIREMNSLGHQDEFPMVSTLGCMIAHGIGLMVSHNVWLSNSHELTKLLYCIVSQP